MFVVLDAMGTLIRVRHSVPHQYAVAVQRASDGALHLPLANHPRALTQFVAAYRSRAQQHPCFGAAQRMTALQWWKPVVLATLTDSVEATSAPRITSPHRNTHAGSGSAPTAEVLDRIAEDAFAHFGTSEAWELYPDVNEALHRLRAAMERAHAPGRIAVLSNTDARLRVVLRQLGIADYFSHILVSHELGAEKPVAKVFHAAERCAPHGTQRFLYVCSPFLVFSFSVVSRED